MQRRRMLAAVGAVAMIAVACGDSTAPTTSAGDPAGTTTSGPAPTVAPTTAAPGAGGLPEGPSALRVREDPSYPAPLVDPSLIRSGGPPPDGIPPIDDPQFVSTAVADEYLSDTEPVVLVEIDGDAQAFPVQVMTWHEIVNGKVGGVPVSVTYCPLCNSAATYVREVRGVETTFGTSGSLYASSLVMYDRATETLWTHFNGQAVVGLLAGDQLESIPSPLLAWGDFKESYPDGQVLDRERTGFARRYGDNPYVGYDDPDTRPFLFLGDPDTRAKAKQRIVGVTVGDVSKAYTLDLISGGTAKATNDEIGGTRIAILWRAGQASALETDKTGEGRDVGSVGVFPATIDGQELTFAASGDSYVDEETGSTWDVTGAAVSGPLAGSKLARLPHLDTFWFAWATFSPETELIESPEQLAQ